ncbi:hypothetical protein ACJX0J_037849, partial [Zea mays]
MSELMEAGGQQDVGYLGFIILKANNIFLIADTRANNILCALTNILFFKSDDFYFDKKQAVEIKAIDISKTRIFLVSTFISDAYHFHLALFTFHKPITLRSPDHYLQTYMTGPRFVSYGYLFKKNPYLLTS